MKTRATTNQNLGENYIYYEQIKNVTQMMRTPQARALWILILAILVVLPTI